MDFKSVFHYEIKCKSKFYMYSKLLGIYHIKFICFRNHQWALYCQRLLGESGKKRLNVTPNSRICSDHFKPEQFVKNAATILKKTAVPCINPEVSSKLQNPNSQSLFAEFNDSSSNILSSCSLDISPSNDFDSSSLIQIKKGLSQERSRF